MIRRDNYKNGNKTVIQIVRIIILCILVYFFAGNPDSACQKVHVYTKVMEKTLPYTGNKLKIFGEKAQIQITGTNQQEISIKIKLVSKNKDQVMAKNDLRYVEANIHQSGEEIYVNNYLTLPKNIEKLTSNIQVFYEITLPENFSDIHIKNKIGTVKMSGLNGVFTIDADYTNIEMNQISGKIRVYSKFGDIICNKSNFNGVFSTEYSKMNMTQFGGTNTIIARSGSLSLQPDLDLKYLKIMSKNTGIIIINKDCQPLNYDITANMGSIYINDSCILQDSKKIKLDTRNIKNLSRQFIYTIDDHLGTILIQSDYEDIHIQ